MITSRLSFRLSEDARATNIRNSGNTLKDDVYSRIADLDTIEGMFAGDLYYHRSNEWKESFDTNHLEPTSK